MTNIQLRLMGLSLVLQVFGDKPTEKTEKKTCEIKFYFEDCNMHLLAILLCKDNNVHCFGLCIYHKNFTQVYAMI